MEMSATNEYSASLYVKDSLSQKQSRCCSKIKNLGE